MLAPLILLGAAIVAGAGSLATGEGLGEAGFRKKLDQATGYQAPEKESFLHLMEAGARHHKGDKLALELMYSRLNQGLALGSSPDRMRDSLDRLNSDLGFANGLMARFQRPAEGTRNRCRRSMVQMLRVGVRRDSLETLAAAAVHDGSGDAGAFLRRLDQVSQALSKGRSPEEALAQAPGGSHGSGR